MERKYRIEVKGKQHIVSVKPHEGKESLIVQVDGQEYNVKVEPISPTTQVESTQIQKPKAVPTKTPTRRPSTQVKAGTSPGEVLAPIPGKVLEVHVKIGQRVSSGDPLVVLEAMKMKNDIFAPVNGVVAEVVSAGDTVNYNDLLVRIETT